MSKKKNRRFRCWRTGIRKSFRRSWYNNEKPKMARHAGNESELYLKIRSLLSPGNLPTAQPSGQNSR